MDRTVGGGFPDDGTPKQTGRVAHATKHPPGELVVPFWSRTEKSPTNAMSHYSRFRSDGWADRVPIQLQESGSGATQ